MSAAEVKPLLDRFSADARQAVPLDALWVHGSLALGDYQVGRSDIDVVAVVATALTGPPSSRTDSADSPAPGSMPRSA